MTIPRFISLMFASAAITVAVPEQPPAPDSSVPSQIAPKRFPQSRFQPPTEFVGQLGAYRSPLRFEDGTPVGFPTTGRADARRS